MESIEKKINQSLQLIRAYSKQHNLALAYSGGKDSDICLRLCKLAHVEVEIVYNNTTIDPPQTISRNIKQGAFINRPELSFYQLVAQKGIPNRIRRFCCQYLKERYISSYVIVGVRKAESVKRLIRYKEPTSCYIYRKNLVSELIYPILNWTQADIKDFILMENLQLHPNYYDSNGQLCIERRLGCIGCPLTGDRGKADFLKYPKALRQLVRNALIFEKNHNSNRNVYYELVKHLFYSNHGQYKYHCHYCGLFEKPDSKALLESYFHVNLSF